jgi:hypothetical protein
MSILNVNVSQADLESARQLVEGFRSAHSPDFGVARPSGFSLSTSLRERQWATLSPAKMCASGPSFPTRAESPAEGIESLHSIPSPPGTRARYWANRETDPNSVRPSF